MSCIFILFHFIFSLNWSHLSSSGGHFRSGESRREDGRDRDGGRQHCVLHAGRRPHRVRHGRWRWRLRPVSLEPPTPPTPHPISRDGSPAQTSVRASSDSRAEGGEHNGPAVLLSRRFLQLACRVPADLGPAGRAVICSSLQSVVGFNKMMPPHQSDLHQFGGAAAELLHTKS